MTETVKRHYRSALRDEQARATRQVVVIAAARLFVERGYGATTIDAIADEAGVSRKTVFTSVGGKALALKLAIDWAIVGDDEPVALMDRPRVRAQMVEPDPRLILSDFAHDVRGIGERIAPLVAVAAAAAGTDPEVRALVEDGRSQRLAGMRRLAGVLADRGALRPGLSVDEAADVLWLLHDPAVYHRLVLEQGWEAARYEQWLAHSLIRLLLVDDTP
ncbi:MAG: helix-turn-helix domain-containing protein [Acidimicrobiales bacterium]|jgi:AcrR family transcriptional regulator